MKKSFLFPVAIVFLFFLFSGHSAAHFGMLIPSDSMVMPDEDRTVRLELSFSHPFERVGMEMTKPVAFGVMAHGRKTSLLDTLKETKIMGHTAWESFYRIKRPGVYMFYMEPEPYWEPAEDCYIVHYTKTVVTAFGDDEGWDEEVGLKTEIVPLSKPYGLYRGNVFQGIVKLEGKPVPFCEVEVEYYNRDGRATAPTDYMIAQTIKADANGVFTYSAPGSGWWGFAALNTSKEKINGKDVECGAVLWVRFHDWK
jgi:cobalt/nickel transport protein